MYILGAIMDI